MPPVIDTGDLLYPLSTFYDSGELEVPEAKPVHADEVPEPHRSLLVHSADMTSTLETYYGGPVRLRVIGKREEGDTLARQVVLTLGDERPVEFGAIILYMQRFSPPVAALIRAGERPLGGILNSHNVVYASRPVAFFRVMPDDRINAALRQKSNSPLYGRRNTLFNDREEPLADIVEILPQ